MGTLKRNILPVVVFALTIYFLLKRDANDTKFKSSDKKVNEAIGLLDVAIDRFGTDESLIYKTFRNLTFEQIVKLFEDFGVRYYDTYTGKYKFLSTGSWKGITKEMHLKEVLISELNEEEINILIEILNDKGYKF